MKTIPLRVLEGHAPNEVTVDYRQLLGECVRRPVDPQRGMDLIEMRRSIRVLDALEAANGTLELEDADYDHLKAKLLAMPWSMADRRILTLADDVLEAT